MFCLEYHDQQTWCSCYHSLSILDRDGLLYPNLGSINFCEGSYWECEQCQDLKFIVLGISFRFDTCYHQQYSEDFLKQEEIDWVNR